MFSLYHVSQRRHFVLTSKIWELQETLHNHNSEETSYDAMESATHGSDTKRNGMAKTSILKNWPLMSSILVYCVFSLHDMTYTEVKIILNLNIYILVQFLELLHTCFWFFLYVFLPWIFTCYLFFLFGWCGGFNTVDHLDVCQSWWVLWDVICSWWI